MFALQASAKLSTLRDTLFRFFVCLFALVLAPAVQYPAGGASPHFHLYRRDDSKKRRDRLSKGTERFLCWKRNQVGERKMICPTQREAQGEEDMSLGEKPVFHSGGPEKQ